MTNLEFYKEEIVNEVQQALEVVNSANMILLAFQHFYKNHISDEDVCSLETFFDWLCDEHQILDKEEKEYLSAVIKPFRKRIYTIQKCKYKGSINYICIRLCDVLSCRAELLTLPNFEEGTMYKGMELNKDYTLKDLGL